MHVTRLGHVHGFRVALFVFVVFAFLLLGYRTERHDGQLRRAQQEIAQSQGQITRNFDFLADSIHDDCEARNVAARKFNAALEAAVLADPDVRADPQKRAAALTSVAPFKQIVDDCDRYPRPAQGAH